MTVDLVLLVIVMYIVFGVVKLMSAIFWLVWRIIKWPF